MLTSFLMENLPMAIITKASYYVILDAKVDSCFYSCSYCHLLNLSRHSCYQN